MPANSRFDDDEYFDALLHAAAQHTDPVRTVPLPEPQDPDVLLDDAQRGLEQLGSMQRWWRSMRGPLLLPSTPGPFGVAAGVFVLILVGLIGVVFVTRNRSLPAPPPVYGAPAILDLKEPDRAPPPASTRLRFLSSMISGNPDTLPDEPYTFVRTQIWDADLSRTPPPSTVTPAVEALWWNANRSGARIHVDLPPEPAGTAVIPDERSTRAVLAAADPTVFPPGHLAPLLPDPPTSPALLAGQLDYHNGSKTPQGLIRAIVEMCQWQALNPNQRAALLQVLSDVQGLVDLGDVTDRAGRPGFAVALDSTDADNRHRDVLIFDAHDGRLLDYERILLSLPARPDIPTPSLESYVVFLTATRVDAIRLP